MYLINCISPKYIPSNFNNRYFFHIKHETREAAIRYDFCWLVIIYCKTDALHVMMLHVNDQLG